MPFYYFPTNKPKFTEKFLSRDKKFPLPKLNLFFPFYFQLTMPNQRHEKYQKIFSKTKNIRKIRSMNPLKTQDDLLFEGNSSILPN